jgi:hypothetical protein
METPKKLFLFIFLFIQFTPQLYLITFSPLNFWKKNGTHMKYAPTATTTKKYSHINFCVNISFLLYYSHERSRFREKTSRLNITQCFVATARANLILTKSWNKKTIFIQQEPLTFSICAHSIDIDIWIFSNSTSFFLSLLLFHVYCSRKRLCGMLTKKMNVCIFGGRAKILVSYAKSKDFSRTTITLLFHKFFYNTFFFARECVLCLSSSTRGSLSICYLCSATVC